MLLALVCEVGVCAARHHSVYFLAVYFLEVRFLEVRFLEDEKNEKYE